MCGLQRPQSAGTLLQVWPLVLVVVAVAGIAHVHGGAVGRVLVIGHALRVAAGKPLLGLDQRAMRIDDVIAVARIVVGEFPVAFEFDAVGLADRDLAAGIASSQSSIGFVIGPRCSTSGSASMFIVPKMKPR